MEFINLKKQYQLYKTQIDQAIQSVIESGQFIMGHEIERLEKKLAEFVGVKHCLGVSSGTDALLLALKAAGVQPGDEVICVPFTWVSPIECVCRLKAKPVFVDINLDTYLIDEDALEAAVTPKTKAIIPVSLYGQMPDFSKINEIAKKYNLVVIEDGAQSFGATQNERRSCSLSTIATTSFFPTKPLGCFGDGGAIFTNQSELAEKMFALRVHGAPERYNHEYIGMNGRLDTLQAAIIEAKLPFFEQELQQRGQIADYFNEQLSGIYTTPITREGNTHSYAQYVLRHPNRIKVLEYLKEKNIPSAVYYPKCIHVQPAYLDLGYNYGDFPNAEQVAREVFSIPMHPFLTSEDQEAIVCALKEVLLEEAIQ